jgi:hypothetical protein
MSIAGRGIASIDRTRGMGICNGTITTMPGCMRFFRVHRNGSFALAWDRIEYVQRMRLPGQAVAVVLD